MTFLLNHLEDLATITVTIYHRTDRSKFFETATTLGRLGDSVEFELAYTYGSFLAQDNASADLEKIWRENNLVDGHEVNALLEKRSLSVGDVIAVGDHNLFTGENVFEVLGGGFGPVTVSRVKLALILARKAAQTEVK